jgi:hypothetical protein
MSLRGVPKSRDDAAISALLYQAPLSDVILSLGEESRPPCPILSPLAGETKAFPEPCPELAEGLSKDEGDLQMGSLEHPLQALWLKSPRPPAGCIWGVGLYDSYLG